jgi:hypothetical protein
MMPHPRPVRRRYEMLRGLGVAFTDLPNGGHNLRLYTYDPIGSQFGPKNSCGSEPVNTWVYNTGHYDISLGTPCSQPDAQGFCDWNTMAQYAAGRGETLVLVSRADLTALCGYRAPVQPVSVATPGATPSGLTPGRPVSQPTVPTGTTPGAGGTVSTTVTTTTTPTTATSSGGGGGGGGGGWAGGGAGPGGAIAAPDNTMLLVGIAALAFVMLSK